MYELAKRENVSVNFPELPQRQTWERWEKDDLFPYMEIALDAFGPQRMMFGSDWPVARLAIEYGPWVEICREFISSLVKMKKA